jgi:hypothetical protein
MMVMEERGNWTSGPTKVIMGQLHSFAEEAERMRLFHKGLPIAVENSTFTTTVFQTLKPGPFSSVTTVTDGERTSNSGSDTGTPVAASDSGIPFQALERAWRMRSVESCNGGDEDDMENGAGTSLEDNEDMKESHEDMEMASFLGDSSVQSKLCPRGHWRPAEDDKLRELVSQYGPQNWNLIAEKLQGRSGTVLFSLRGFS